MTTTSRGSCYCEDGETTCGDCQICEKPGHTRHFPGPVPYTGSWCDEHYDMLAEEFSPSGSGAPTQCFKVSAAGGSEDTQCIYVACHGDWAISLVVIGAASTERFDRDTTFDRPEFWDIWFVPVSMWTGNLQPIFPEDFEAVYSATAGDR